MIHILAELAPLKVSDGSRPVLRASSAQDRALNGVTGQKWWPAISKRPALAIPLFDGDFTQDVEAATASFTVRLDGLVNLDSDARGYRWAGAPVSIYAIDTSTALNAAGSYDVASLDAIRAFRGRVEGFNLVGNALTITAEIDKEPFEKDVLALTYAGTGDAEGGQDLKGRLKPWIFGRALNVEPILVNSVDSVVQFSAYSVQGISALYERGASFGPSIGNYPTYAALVAANIPAGKWATCHALGMARLGAPPYGVITGDVDGDNTSGFLRRTGAIIQRVATARGVTAALIDTASLNALDAAVPYDINLVLTEQISVLDLARRLARPCNAQAGLDFQGRLFAVRPTIGTPALTLDAQGRQLPPVRQCQEAEVSAPYKRIMFGANRSWRVHTFDEIAFDAELIDRGDYDPAKTYRRGNIVSLPNGSRWLYVNDTPKAGSLPAETNTDWELMTGAITAGNITYEDGTPVEALKPAEPGATAGAPPGTPISTVTSDDVLAALMAVASVTDPNKIVEGALALIDRTGNHSLALYEAQLLGEARKARFDRLTHFDGIEITTRVRQEITERIEEGVATVIRINEIEAAATDGVNAAMASIAELEVTTASAIAAETLDRQTQVSQLRLDVDGYIADVQAALAIEASTRADEIAAEAALRAALATSFATELAATNAAVVTEQDARASGDEAEATAREALAATLSGDIADVSAAVETEATARAAEDGALASLISGVQTTVDGHTASVALLLESVDGLNSRLVARVVSGDMIGGFELAAGGGEIDANFLVDNFRVLSPSGGDGWQFSDGRQVTTGGTIMTITGAPFGSSNQFLEWTGPIVSTYEECTEANAIKYMKIDGSAYFGGGLSSGILKNEATSNVVSSTAFVTVGPFTSNGNTVNININARYYREYQADSGTGGITGSGSGVITVEHSTDGTNWTSIGTMGVAESLREVIVDGEPGVPDVIQWEMSGAGTLIWNPGPLSGLFIRARWTSRLFPAFNGTPLFGTEERQSVTIIAVETP